MNLRGTEKKHPLDNEEPKSIINIQLSQTNVPKQQAFKLWGTAQRRQELFTKEHVI